MISNWFVFLRVVGNQRYVLSKCIRWKIFEQIGIGMAYLHVFLITIHEIDVPSEVYLEPFQRYMIELFCENSSRLLALNSKKAPL